MTKKEFVSQVASASGVTQKTANKVVNAALETLMNAIAQGEKISFQGFGAFEKRDRAERTNINPQTKEKIITPAKSVPHFAPGKIFKDLVRNGDREAA